MTSLVQVRIDKKLKEDAEALFADLGLDITTALRMFLKEAVREQKIPLKLKNTQKAWLKEAKKMQENPQDYKAYDDIDEMFKDILKWFIRSNIPKNSKRA